MKRYKQLLLERISRYRELRPSNLTEPRFRHIFLLLFWAIFGIAFALVEKSDRDWIYVEWDWLDDLIPFCEWFVIPYIFWFAFLAGTVAFTLLFDVEAFRKMMYFIMITYTVTLVIYLIWPTAQGLRPNIATLGRDNVLTRFMAGFYDYDTHTNVCPSIHVLGAVASLVASWHTPFFKGRAWQIFFWVSTVLITLSTVFLKQHSILDVFAALALCVIAYPLACHGSRILRRRQPPCEARQTATVK
jgi:hypothetical protein